VDKVVIVIPLAALPTGEPLVLTGSSDEQALNTTANSPICKIAGILFNMVTLR
jgi:hypothetical protein